MRKILIIKLRLIGDIIVSTPVYRNIKEHEPQSLLHVAVEKGYEAPLQQNPFIDKIIPVDTSSLRGKIAFIQRIRAEKYDLVLNLHGGTTSGYFTLLSGGKERAGFDRRRYCYNRPLSFSHEGLTASRFYLRVLNEMGIPTPFGETEIFLTKEEREKIKASLTEQGVAGKYLLVHPAVKKKNDAWSAEYYAAVLNTVSRHYSISVVLSCGPGQESQLQAIEKHLDAPADARFASGLSLRLFMALIESSSVLLCPDSSPMHIAAAFKKPMVALFGSISPEKWSYHYNEYHKVYVEEMPCRASCTPAHMLPECFEGRSPCQMQITPKMVLQELEPLLQLIEKGKG